MYRNSSEIVRLATILRDNVLFTRNNFIYVTDRNMRHWLALLSRNGPLRTISRCTWSVKLYIR